MASRQRTCDRCYRIKARCTFVGNSSQCARCERLRHECSTKRSILRPGPKTAQSLDAARYGSSKIEAISPVTSTKTEDEADSSQIVPSSKASHAPAWRTSGLALPTSLDPLSHAIRDFNILEVQVLEYMFNVDAFISKYADPPAFQESLRGMFIRQLVENPVALKDGYIACGEAAIRKFSPTMVIEDEETTLRRSARALSTLMTLRPSSKIELSTLLSLALSIITYSIQSLGLQIRPIVQSSLRYVQPWLNNYLDRQWVATDSNLICLVFHDTIECLLRREIPAIRFDLPDIDDVVDRYFGVTHSILPILYDLCCVGQQTRTVSVYGTEQHHGNSSEDMIFHLEKLWSRVDCWEPVLSSNMLTQLTSTTIQHVVAQAHCFKLAAQLMILNYYSIIQGSYAQSTMLSSLPHTTAISHDILSTIREVDKQTGLPPRYVGFPFFVALMDHGDPTENDDALDPDGYGHHSYLSHLLENLMMFTRGTSSATCKAMSDFAQFVWTNRDKSNRSWIIPGEAHLNDSDFRSWIELVDHWSSFTIGI